MNLWSAILLSLALAGLAEEVHAKGETLAERGKRICEVAGVSLEECVALPPALRDEWISVRPVEVEAVVEQPGAPSIEPPVRASRAFAGPRDFPPENFAAYGILAFDSAFSQRTRERREMICDAYVAAIPHTDELVEHSVPIDVQMVTVWPVKDGGHLDDINQLEVGPACEAAVRHYDQVVALKAMAEARLAGVRFDGVGPFLLAWSPTQKKGERDAIVLRMDLSKVKSVRQAHRIMRRWRMEIEQRPELWIDGWQKEGLLVTIRDFADEFGEDILSLFGV